MSAIEATIQAVVVEMVTAALPAGGPLLVAVSGGADSLCLLYALHALAPELGLRLQVAHLDHGLRAAAAADAAWVAALCARWGLPCHLGRADVRALAAAQGRSLEDAARQARYAFLAQVAARVDAATVAVGHTADDQAETVLLHLIRGAGLDGLAGMAPASPWPLPDDPRGAALTVLRPLLTVSRAQTSAYCAAVGLAPRLDESNDAPIYTRNRLRLELLPLLRELNPAVVAALGRTAEIVRGEAALLQPLEDDAWRRLARVHGPSVRLARAALALEPVALQRRLLRRAVGALAHRSELSRERIVAALRVARCGRTGACAELPHGLRLRVDYDWLWVEPRDAPRAPSRWPALSAPCRLDIPGEAALANGWRLRARVASRAGLPADWASTARPLTAYLDAQTLGPRAWLRPRRPGDRLQPLGMAGRQKVSDLLIIDRVPAACRHTLPLLTVDDEIAWVVGVRSSQRFAVTTDTALVAAIEVLPPTDQENEGDDG